MGEAPRRGCVVAALGAWTCVVALLVVGMVRDHGLLGVAGAAAVILAVPALWRLTE